MHFCKTLHFDKAKSFTQTKEENKKKILFTKGQLISEQKFDEFFALKSKKWSNQKVKAHYYGK